MGLPVTATLNLANPQAARGAKTLADSLNPGFVFTGNMNLAHTPQYYVRVFNAGYKEHWIERPWVNFNAAQKARMIVIPACKKGENYSKPFIISDIVQEPTYNIGTGEMGSKGTDGKFLAQDAINPEDARGNWQSVRPMNQGIAANQGTNLYHWGLFWTINETPTEDEYKTARNRFNDYMNYLVAEAKQFWMIPNKRIEIGDTHRFAASCFNLTFEWNQIYTETFPCPGCGKPLTQGVVICSSCPATFNWERAIELGLRTVKQALDAGMLEEQAESMSKKKGGSSRAVEG